MHDFNPNGSVSIDHLLFVPVQDMRSFLHGRGMEFNEYNFDVYNQNDSQEFVLCGQVLLGLPFQYLTFLHYIEKDEQPFAIRQDTPLYTLFSEGIIRKELMLGSLEYVRYCHETNLALPDDEWKPVQGKLKPSADLQKFIQT